MLECLFNKVAGQKVCNVIKKRFNTGVFLGNLKTFKDTFLMKHTPVAAFVQYIERCPK